MIAEKHLFIFTLARIKRLAFYGAVVLLLFCACKQKGKHAHVENIVATDTSLKWVDYRIGELPPVNYYNAFDSVIKKWNIRYQRIEGGCEALPEERIVYEKDNNKYFLVLEKKFGHDWLKRFYAEVKALDNSLDKNKSAGIYR